MGLLGLGVDAGLVCGLRGSRGRSVVDSPMLGFSVSNESSSEGSELASESMVSSAACDSSTSIEFFGAAIIGE